MIFEGKLLLSINSFKSAVKLIECIDELIGLGLESVFVIYVIEAGRSGISMGIINEYQEKLENIKLNISAKGLEVNSKLVIGVPHKEIIKAADEYDCSVILISSHNQSLFEQVSLEETNYEVLKRSTKPVLIEKLYKGENNKIEQYCEIKFNTILVPLDFTACSDNLIESIIDLKSTLQKVILLNSIEDFSGKKDYKKKRLESINKLRIYKNRLLSETEINEIKLIVGPGSASDLILNVADKEKASMIMMLTIGINKVEKMKLGSTADRVAKKAELPLLMIPCEYL